MTHPTSKERSFSLWLFLRDVLSQGAHIYEAHKSYETYSARLDATARDLEEQLRKASGLTDETSVPSHEALADHLKTLTASTNCPVCGKSGMHEHTPTELIIYRNGVKYGRSLYEPRIGVPRLGQCEAIVPERWSQPAHRCEFQATTDINGKKLCGHHLKGSVVETSALHPGPSIEKAFTRSPRRQAGVVCTIHGSFPDFTICPECPQKASVDRQIQPPTPCTGCEGKPEFPNIPCSICGMYPDGTSV